jgi:hypothetical protein
MLTSEAVIADSQEEKGDGGMGGMGMGMKFPDASLPLADSCSLIVCNSRGFVQKWAKPS